MSSIEERIAEVILRHQRNEWGQHDGWWECCCQHGGPPVPWSAEHVAGVVAEALHPRVETVEQLHALPHRALVVREYTSQAGWHLNEVWEKRNGDWFCLAAPLIPPGQNWGTPALPVSLVYKPAVLDSDDTPGNCPRCGHLSHLDDCACGCERP